MAEKYEYADDLKIFIWNPSVDHLRFDTWLALQSFVQIPITFVLGFMENILRKDQDWKQVDLNKLDPILISPDKLWREGLKLLRENKDAIHVFQSFRGINGYDYLPLILFALRKGIKVAVLNEAYSTSPVGYFRDENPLLAQFRTWVRPMLYRAIANALYAVSGTHKPCILPLSLIAKQQLIKAGFAPETLFPFGYFVPRQQIAYNNHVTSSPLRLIFVGALIARKGLDILVGAIQELHEQGSKITLDIYGSGDSKKVIRPNLPINFKGTLPFDQIQAAIAEHDILVLPSRHDGWGVVVNEALLQGVPVILSSRVGAKCLIESTGAGLVFESENMSDLARKIKILIENPHLLQELRDNALMMGRKILPEMGAQYFLDSLSYYFYKIGVRPSAIWSKDLAEYDILTGHISIPAN